MDSQRTQFNDFEWTAALHTQFQPKMEKNPSRERESERKSRCQQMNPQRTIILF